MSKKKEKTAPLKTMVYKQMLYSMKEPPVNNGVNYLKPKVREASKSDLGSLVNIYNISWMTSNTPFRNLTVKTMENLHNNRDIIILIAKVYGIDAGFIILDFEGAEKNVNLIISKRFYELTFYDAFNLDLKFNLNKGLMYRSFALDLCLSFLLTQEIKTIFILS